MSSGSGGSTPVSSGSGGRTPVSSGSRWCSRCCWYRCCSRDPSPPSALCWEARSLRDDTVRIPSPETKSAKLVDFIIECAMHVNIIIKIYMINMDKFRLK